MKLLSKAGLKDFVYGGIGNIGHALTPHAYAMNLELASHLRQLFAFLEITCVLDVGANRGQYRNFLRRRCGYPGLIISYEPVRATFQELKENSRLDKKWLVFNQALGAVSGERELNVMRETTFSSFCEPQSTDICKTDMANVVDHRETVTVRRLDEVVAELSKVHDLSRVYLKMDTQGHDLEVLKGLERELHRVFALQSEVAVKPIYRGMPAFTESMNEIARRGFEVTGLFPVQRDEVFRIIEFDCVAVNFKQIAQAGLIPK